MPVLLFLLVTLWAEDAFLGIVVGLLAAAWGEQLRERARGAGRR